MRRWSWIAPAAFVVVYVQIAAAAPLAVKAVEQNPDGVTVRLDGGVMRLQVFSERAIQVQFAPGDALPEGRSLAVIGSPDGAKWNYQETPEALVVATGVMQARVNRKSGAINFTDAANKAYLTEAPEGGKTVGQHARQEFRLSADEAIYGLGQHQAGMLNYRGSTVRLQQANTDVAVPMLVSSKGYGLLWDSAGVGDVDISIPTAPDRLVISSEAPRSINYFFLAGPELDDVIAAYRKLTGPAPLMPRWSWGFWQSRERYKTQEEILGVAARYRKMGVPIDGIVQDWQYWAPEQWGSHEFDPKRFPDPTAMVAQLHKDNYHVIVSVWPKFDLATSNLAELERAGAVYPTTFPSVYPKGQQKWFDPFRPAGRKIYWQQIATRLGKLGFDGWWLDASEAELGGKWGEMREQPTGAGPGATVYNAYPLLHTTAVFDGQRADMPDKRVFILTRSAYAGQQRNAAVAWSGDIRGTWDVFRRQIPAGLNFSVSGIPYWNTDIGGFFGGKPQDADYRELFVRWFQFGAFCPMFRVHGTGPAKHIWDFDEPTQKILIAYDELRYRLLPYIYSVSWKVTNQGYTMMRPLVMDFRTDRVALDVTDQYLFGPALLVCPVTQARATSRTVYLPAGTTWYDFWTGKRSEGGVAVNAAAPIETMPLFVRGGSILPLGPVVQYADEKLDAPIELRVYRGADAAFDLYEDEGDSYRYEKGAHATIPLAWSESGKTLTIGPTAGEFPGMVKKRQFKIVFVGEEPAVERTVDYDGKAVTVEGPK